MNKTNTKNQQAPRLFYLVSCTILALALSLSLSCFGYPAEAFAATSAEKQVELDEALARMDVLQTQLNQLAKDYEVAVVEHAEAEAGMLEAQNKEKEAKERIAELQEQLGDRAAEMYRSNGNGSYLDVLFGAQTFRDFVTALDFMNRVNEQDAQLVVETKKVKKEAEEAREEYTELEQITREKQEEIASIKQETEEATTALQAEIEALEAEVVELKLQEELAAEAAREAAANLGVSSYGEVSDEQIARVAALVYHYPFASTQTISSPFGWRDFDESFHLGTDFAAPSGTSILAVGSGTVVAAGVSESMGNYLIISHGNGVRSTYMHCSSLAVGAGTAVAAGQTIAYVGSTGNSTGSHLHLQIDVDNTCVNPMLFI